MKRGLIFFSIISLVSLALPSAGAAANLLADSGRTITQSQESLQVTWQTPPVQSTVLSDGSYVLSLEGFGAVQTPGEPRLPEDSVLVALPDVADPTLRVTILETEELAAPQPIALVPGDVSVPGEEGGLLVFDLTQPSQPETEPVSFVEIGVMRGVRLARLSFHPIHLENGQMTVIRQVTATIHYGISIPEAGLLSAGDIAQDETLASLFTSVVNPTAIEVSTGNSIGSSALVNRAGQAAIEVSQTGLTAITPSALAAAGFPVGSVDPHTLHLEREGVEIPIEWDGNDNTLFEPGEQLLFYAQPRFSRWTSKDVYFLSSGSAPRKEITQRSTAPAGMTMANLWMDQLFEQNVIYTPDCYCAPIPAGRDGDRWVWDRLRKPDHTSAVYPFALEGVDENQPANITVWLIGYTDVPASTHNVQVQLNGMLLGTLTFTGKQPNPLNQAALSIPAGALVEGSNELTLTLAETGAPVDGVWLDAFSIHFARDLSTVTGQLAATGSAEASQYPITLTSTNGLRAYDVTNPDTPVRLTGIVADAVHAALVDPTGDLPRRYAVAPSGSLHTPDLVRMATPLQSVTGADYIAISAPEFIADLPDLVSLRQSQGLNVVVENVQAIYDAVDGRPQPEAIRDYLAAAYAQWNPRPAYVLLVGDGTTDPRQYRSSSSKTWIPPFLANVDPVMGEAAADNRYVMVDGSDRLPDMAIGRLPVNSHIEAAITISKIVKYERHPPSGEWSRQMLLVSDKNDPNAGYFAAENNAIAEDYANSRYNLIKLEHEAIPSQPEIHQAVLDGWNQGYGLILYNGHASTHQWGADILFHLNDLPSLVNADRLPVLLEMTCLTASFQVPDVPTLDETLLRRSGKGVAAALGSTGLGMSSGAMLIAHGLLDQIMQHRDIRFGDAIGQAKLEMAATAPALEYLVDIYTLLGDPAMKINYRHDAYLPAIQSANH